MGKTYYDPGPDPPSDWSDPPSSPSSASDNEPRPLQPGSSDDKPSDNELADLQADLRDGEGALPLRLRGGRALSPSAQSTSTPNTSIPSAAFSSSSLHDLSAFDVDDAANAALCEDLDNYADGEEADSPEDRKRAKKRLLRKKRKAAYKGATEEEASGTLRRAEAEKRRQRQDNCRKKEGRKHKDLVDSIRKGVEKQFESVVTNFDVDAALRHPLPPIDSSKAYMDRVSESIESRIEDDTVIYAVDGKTKIAVYFRHALDRFSHLKDKSQEFAQLLRAYQEVNPPPFPSKNDPRHNGEQRRPGLGVAHLCQWPAQGHPVSAATSSKDAGNLSTKKGAAVMGHFSKLADDLAPVFAAVSTLFEAAFPETHAEYRSGWREHVQSTAFGKLLNCDSMAWAGMAILFGLHARNHRDGGDCLKGIAALFCFGDFSGGDFILPDQGLRLCYQPGDVILLMSSILPHFVRPFLGERFSIVLFTKRGMGGDSDFEMELKEEKEQIKRQAVDARTRKPKKKTRR